MFAIAENILKVSSRTYDFLKDFYRQKISKDRRNKNTSVRTL